MSLRDQLLQVGLVDENAVKSAEKQQKKQKHAAHKNKTIAKQLSTEQQEKEAFRQHELQTKRERDQILNKEREKARARKEALIRARSLLESNRKNNKQAEERFNFCPDGKKIRFVLVTSEQKHQLSRGELAICRNDRDPFDYPLIPREQAEILQKLEGNWVLFLNDLNDGRIDENDEWAAWPDDL